MKYNLSEKYNIKTVNEKIMGPNPLKLQEELLHHHRIPKGATVMDLGSGQGVTSVMLAKDYGFRVFAADLWSNPGDNMRFFREMGLNEQQIIPIHADANSLPFAEKFFDAVICTDSYNFFGRDKSFLGDKLLPFLKHGGLIYISVPGMKKDCHDALPPKLLLSWTPEQLDYLHDTEYWRDIFSATADAEIVSIREMECNEDVWRDWIITENDYAKNDRKAIEAGACSYLNFVAIVIRRK